MPGNPLIPQGSLNRLRASVVWPDFPNLNITQSYLGRMGIHLAFDGESTLYIPTMTGAVTSPEPIQLITLTAHLLKTVALASAYEAQRVSSALLGNGTVRSDSIALPVYQIINCAIENVRELSFAGDDADYAVTIKGYYLVNNDLWNG
jgi:hypothetical protein